MKYSDIFQLKWNNFMIDLIPNVWNFLYSSIMMHTECFKELHVQAQKICIQ